MHEILIEEKILARNDEIASENRKALKGKGIYSINIVSAPGAGKTSLIERMAGELKTLGVKFAVVEGDLEGDFDSKRIERHGESALKVNPYLKIFETSCRTGAGVDAWAAYLAGVVKDGKKK